MKKIIFTTLFIAFALVISSHALAAPAAPTGGLVPSGCQAGCPCTLCDIYTLGKNIIAFALYGIAVPIVAIAILYGGILMLTSAGNPNKISQGKAAIGNAIVGLAIAFFAWVILNAILVSLTFKIGFGTGGGDVRDWFSPPDCHTSTADDSRCTLTLPTGPVSNGGGVPATCGDAANNCDAGEGPWNCPFDCPANTAGNHSCDPGEADGSPDCPVGAERLGDSNARQILTDAGININKPNCTSTGQTDCTSLEGLNSNTIGGLIRANDYCKNQNGTSCITVTGGTEDGHKSHGIGHPNTVDLRWDAVNGPRAFDGLNSAGLHESGSFGTGYTCERPAGHAVACNSGNIDHIHVEF